HCIAVDPWFIVSEFPEEAKIIRSAREINNYKTEWAIEKVKNAALQFKIENGRDAVIACMGLAFKPNIDDLRESPALHVAEQLQTDGYKVLFVEPNLESHDKFNLTSLSDAKATSDIMVFLVAHKEFRELEIEKTKRIVDFCGI